MIRALAVVCMASAGTWLLAGAGWSLIAAAFLAYAMWPAEVQIRQVLTDFSTALAAARRAARLRRRPGGLDQSVGY
jgi:hypothetical protein